MAGEKCDFYIGNPTGKSWYGSTIDQSIEMRFAKKELIQRGAIAIECGAHHGAQTILLSLWVGDDGKVIVIEPMPDNVAILRKRLMPLLPVRSTCCKEGVGARRRCRGGIGMRRAGCAGG